MQRSETDLQGEYDHAVSEAKKLAKEYDAAVSDDIKLRIKRAIAYAADILEMMDIPKTKIVGKLYADFEGFYSERHIWNILADPAYRESTAIVQRPNSSLNTYEQENEEELAIADELETVIHLLKDKYRTGHWGSLLDPKERKEDNILKRGLIAMAKDVLDERQLIPIPTQPIFVRCAIEFTLQDAYEKYHIIVKDFMKKLTADAKIRGIRTTDKISSKQGHRTAHREVKELHESLIPASINEARALGYSGQVCPLKNSKHPDDLDRLRCNRLPDATEGRWYECMRCDGTFEGINEPAYTGHGIAIDESYSTHSSKTERSEGVGEL